MKLKFIGADILRAFKNLLCKLFGHRSICLYRHYLDRGCAAGTEVTGWYCERCGKYFDKIWDV